LSKKQKKMKKSAIYIFSIILAIALSSCLTVEKKEYTFELKDNSSGMLTIKFINILSMKDDTADISEIDFNEMISGYIEGDQIEQDFPDAIIRSKKLFEENGVLCGEVIIDFNNLRNVGLFQYDSKSPYMFNIGSFLESETFLNSNGEYGGDVMPVVFWPKSLKTLKVSTYITSPDNSTVGLLTEFNKWK